ncbi:uncharacterized protein MKZ38_010067 [Zalerion maritima]|uniref:Uncharacterized protein n=1 Tax=Zalerion maritima TaxID=339359 RepID=A0AAD5RSN8_9PEZI|nr:uncharacterized protein MKZ38_010067 [Zalerion maritima]
MSRRPLLEPTSERSENSGLGQIKNQGSPLLLFSNLFRGGIVVSSDTTFDSVVLMLNAETPEERDELTINWRDHKLEELNFVGTVGALLATCLTSTGAWPDILSNGRDKPWSIRACWYSGIIFALLSVVTAAQQALRLHRLSAHKHGLQFIRQSMVYKTVSSHPLVPSSGHRGGVAYIPARIQVLAWQVSLMFLVTAVVVMIVGMTVLVWVSAAWGPKKRPEDGWWDDGSKMAVTFTVVLCASLAVFLVSQVALTEPRVDGQENEHEGWR